MDWQLIAVVLLIGAATAYLSRETWRSWWSKSGCGGGCGCAAKANTSGRVPLIDSEQLMSRLSVQNRRG